MIEATQPESLERMARYATRAPIALAKVFVQKDGRIRLLTPVHPKTGKDYVIFDPPDWVHAVTTQIPDARQHLVRYQGAYATQPARATGPRWRRAKTVKLAGSGWGCLRTKRRPTSRPG